MRYTAAENAKIFIAKSQQYDDNMFIGGVKSYLSALQNIVRTSREHLRI